MTETRIYTHQEILPVIRGVALAILLSALDQTIVVPAVPKMAVELHGQGHLAWIVAAYLLSGTAATPVFGKLSDIYGRRKLLQPAIIVFVLASMGCAMAQNLPQMIFMRAVQGIGGAGLITIAQTAIADVVPPRERGRYQIYMSGMWGIASIAGPIAGGALTDLLSWRAIFWVNLPLGALAYVSSGRALRILPPHAPGPVKIDYLGAGLLMASITAWLILCASGGRDFAWGSPLASGLAMAGAVLTGLMIWQERRAVTPMLPLHIFGNKIVLGGLALSFTNSLCTFGGTFLLPLYFQYVRGTNAAASGAFTTPLLLAFVVMSYAGGHIARWLGRTKPTILVALSMCLAGLLLLASMESTTNLGLCVFYMVLLGGGIGLVQPNVTVAIQNAAERRDVGVATGSMLLFRAIGGAAGATLAGTMLLAAGFHAAFGACAVAALLALVIGALMRDSSLRSVH
ncbi:MAG: MDR family MFS transporter [Acidocella sp.]|nr:MDR family MFS transporter [Acidocella sp.]